MMLWWYQGSLAHRSVIEISRKCKSIVIHAREINKRTTSSITSRSYIGSYSSTINIHKYSHIYMPNVCIILLWMIVECTIWDRMGKVPTFWCIKCIDTTRLSFGYVCIFLRQSCLHFSFVVPFPRYVMLYNQCDFWQLHSCILINV